MLSWTRDTASRAEAAGVFGDRRFELIAGGLVERDDSRPPHSGLRLFIGGWLTDVFGRHSVRNQMPINVRPEENPANRPQPDLCVTSLPARESLRRDPVPSEILLLMEVSDSTLAFDTTVKAALYARAGIAEYWVADVASRRLIVNRSPSAGRYQSVTMHSESDPVSPLAAPSAALRLADLTGGASETDPA